MNKNPQTPPTPFIIFQSLRYQLEYWGFGTYGGWKLVVKRKTRKSGVYRGGVPRPLFPIGAAASI